MNEGKSSEVAVEAPLSPKAAVLVLTKASVIELCAAVDQIVARMRIKELMIVELPSRPLPPELELATFRHEDRNWIEMNRLSEHPNPKRKRRRN